MSGSDARRTVLFVPDRGVPQSEWREWRELFEQAGYRTLAPEAADLAPEDFILRTAELMLARIDELDFEPYVVGVGQGALVALCVADASGARATVAIGGPAIPIAKLGLDPDSGLSGPVLLMGGSEDPELPVSALEDRYGAYESEHDPERDRLLLFDGTARSIAFGEDWRVAATAALEFFTGPSRGQRALKLLKEFFTSLLSA